MDIQGLFCLENKSDFPSFNPVFPSSLRFLSPPLSLSFPSFDANEAYKGWDLWHYNDSFETHASDTLLSFSFCVLNSCHCESLALRHQRWRESDPEWNGRDLESSLCPLGILRLSFLWSSDKWWAGKKSLCQTWSPWEGIRFQGRLCQSLFWGKKRRSIIITYKDSLCRPHDHNWLLKTMMTLTQITVRCRSKKHAVFLMYVRVNDRRKLSVFVCMRNRCKTALR